MNLTQRVALILENIKIKYIAEYRFCQTRRWRFDFAILPQKIAIECEGGIFSKGRHIRGVGYSKDCDKYNYASIDGWKILRYTILNIEQMENDLKKLL